MLLPDILRPFASSTLKNPEQWFTDLIGGGTTRAGVAVSPDKAFGLPAVFSVVSFLAEVESSLPVSVFRRDSDGATHKDSTHPVTRLLQGRANPMMDGLSLRQAMIASAELRGNGYAEIVRNDHDQPIELWFLDSRNMTLEIFDDGTLAYTYTQADGKRVGLRAKDVLHRRALTLNGFLGVSPLTICRENIGIGLAGEGNAAAFYGNGSVPNLALTVPGSISPKLLKENKRQWKEAHGGVDNAHKTAVIQGGMTIEKIGVDPDNAQALESRKFSVTDIARMFRVPPHIVGDLEKATFSNIEEQGREVVRYSLAPRLKRWETEIDTKLLGAAP